MLDFGQLLLIVDFDHLKNLFYMPLEKNIQ